MPDHAAFGVLATRLNDVHGNAGRARSQDRVRRSDFVHLGKKFDLEVGPFRGVFLNEVGLRHRLGHVDSEGQSVATGTRGKADNLECLPGLVDVIA